MSGDVRNLKLNSLGRLVSHDASAACACCCVEGALVPYLVNIPSRALHHKLAEGLLVVQHLASLLQNTQHADSVGFISWAQVDTAAMHTCLVASFFTLLLAASADL